MWGGEGEEMRTTLIRADWGKLRVNKGLSRNTFHLE